MTRQEIADELGVSRTIVDKMMKKFGLRSNGNNNRDRIAKFNIHVFDTIDTEEKAYWLGFLYADGSVGTTDKSCTAPNRLAINISSKDKNLLYDFLSDVEAYDTKIMDYMPSEKTYGNTMMSRVYLNSKTLCSHLIEHGCVPNKTFDISMPDLPPKMISHFIRGLFDGDGNITSGPTFRITGYHIFMAQIHTLLNISCNLNSRTSLKYYPEKDPRICDLCFGGPNLCTKIFHYLYDNATICLQRKFEKFKTLTK
jgi:hypothetical protein